MVSAQEGTARQRADAGGHVTKMNPVYEQATMREIEQGLEQTIKLFRQLGLGDAQIAFMFRAMADRIDPPTIVHQEPRLPQ